MRSITFSYGTVRVHVEDGTAMNPASHLGVFCGVLAAELESMGSVVRNAHFE